MKEKNEIEQLNMGLQEPFFNRFKNFKYKFELFFVKLRTNSLFTAPFLWITSVLTASFILVQYHYYTSFIDKLPKEIPLFSIAKISELKLVNKEYMLIIFILSVILAIISLFISLKIFYRSKFMSIFIMTNLVLAMLLITISYIKIFGVYIF